MNQSLIKDNRQRFFFSNTECYRTYSKTFFYSQKINFKARWLFYMKTTGSNQLNQYSTKVKAHNFCVVSGRAHSVYRKFKLARMILRKKSFNGELPGVLKASW